MAPLNKNILPKKFQNTLKKKEKENIDPNSTKVKNNKSLSHSHLRVKDKYVVSRKINLDELLCSNTRVKVNHKKDEFKKIIQEKKLNKKRNDRCTMFVDSSKNNIKFISTLSNSDGQIVLPQHTNINCWYHRCKFTTNVKGCPKKYYPPPKTANERKTRMKLFKSLNIAVEDNDELDFFETEGFFCSLECVLAYIRSDPQLKDRETLFTLMCLKLFGESVVINPAKSWKFLDTNGGHLTNTDYMNENQYSLIETTNQKRPYMFCSSNFFLEIEN
jgi:hypothetical protein